MRFRLPLQLGALLIALAFWAVPTVAQTDRGQADAASDEAPRVQHQTRRARAAVQSAEGLVVDVRRDAARGESGGRRSREVLPNGLMEITIQTQADWSTYAQEHRGPAERGRTARRDAAAGEAGDLKVLVTPETRLHLHYRTADGTDLEGEPAAAARGLARSGGTVPAGGRRAVGGSLGSTAAERGARPGRAAGATDPAADDAAAEDAAAPPKGSTQLGSAQAADATATGAPPRAIVEGSTSAANTRTSHEVASRRGLERSTGSDLTRRGSAGADTATVGGGGGGRAVAEGGGAAAVGRQSYGTAGSTTLNPGMATRPADVHDGAFVMVRYRREGAQNVALNLHVIRPANEPGDIPADTGVDAVEPATRGRRATGPGSVGGRTNRGRGADTDTGTGRLPTGGRAGGRTGSATEDVPGGNSTP